MSHVPDILTRRAVVEVSDTIEYGYRRPLAVLIHGLVGHPTDMKVVRDRIANYSAVYSPRVKAGGTVALDECVDDIQRVIQLHIDRHGPQAPITLVGLSNGGRIAAQLEINLRQTHANPILLATVATPFDGTDVIDWLWYPAMARYGRVIVKELSRGSEVNRQLVEKLDESVPDHTVRKFVFYAAASDGLVQPIQSALPTLQHPSEHVLLKGHGHVSVISAVADQHHRRWRQFILDHALSPKPRSRKANALE